MTQSEYKLVKEAIKHTLKLCAGDGSKTHYLPTDKNADSIIKAIASSKEKR